jgi:dTDP-4-dehydrorhamnose 3,5-epimerase
VVNCVPTALEGVLIIERAVYQDPRGYFFETWRADRYATAGVPDRFVQANVSRSSEGTLRGLHVQHPYGQGKLIQVLDGEIFDVAVDVRRGSPTFGKWVGQRLSADNHLQMYIPAGFAHGFCVLSASALVTYQCTELYHPETEFGIAWNDPAVAIAWPVASPLLSKKDGALPLLADLPADRLPPWPA